MSGHGLKDMWFWDSEGDFTAALSKRKWRGDDIKEYQRLTMRGDVNICSECGSVGHNCPTWCYMKRMGWKS